MDARSPGEPPSGGPDGGVPNGIPTTQPLPAGGFETAWREDFSRLQSREDFSRLSSLAIAGTHQMTSQMPRQLGAEMFRLPPFATQPQVSMHDTPHFIPQSLPSTLSPRTFPSASSFPPLPGIERRAGDPPPLSCTCIDVSATGWFMRFGCF
jgi:hypothetical protein